MPTRNGEGTSEVQEQLPRAGSSHASEIDVVREISKGRKSGEKAGDTSRKGKREKVGDTSRKGKSSKDTSKEPKIGKLEQGEHVLTDVKPEISGSDASMTGQYRVWIHREKGDTTLFSNDIGDLASQIRIVTGSEKLEALNAEKDERGKSVNGLERAKALHAKKDGRGKSVNAVKGAEALHAERDPKTNKSLQGLKAGERLNAIDPETGIRLNVFRREEKKYGQKVFHDGEGERVRVRKEKPSKEIEGREGIVNSHTNEFTTSEVLAEQLERKGPASLSRIMGGTRSNREENQLLELRLARNMGSERIDKEDQ